MGKGRRVWPQASAPTTKLVPMSRRLRLRLWLLDLPPVRRWWRWYTRDIVLKSDEAPAERD
jgi:hypothetical protein